MNEYSNSPLYRVAIIGCGKRARAHVPGLLADSRCTVVALADVSRAAADAMNTDYGFGAAVYLDHRELLERERPDVVIVTLWTPLHLPVYKDCVAAGVRAVLSEKPMAPAWGECLEIARIAEESGCQLTFCHQRRFAQGNQLARHLIAEGRLGKLERMDLFSPPNLLDCGTHTLDQALSFNEEIPAKWVLGAVDTTQLLQWFGVSAEGMATGTLVFGNGVRASIQVGGPDMDLWGGVRVTGSEGFLEVLWDGQFQRAVVYADPAWQPPTLPDETADAPMIGVVRNALDCLESGAEPELSYQKALRASEIIFALYESVRSHTRVALPLTGVSDNPFLTMLANGEFEQNEEKPNHD
ncbi:MAG: Gfo/Idh/MocA family oxidoreductase [Cytophagales bacterium]|nr:Gfo/Idh/MocA family oxidoreductase [Armatimonadota bacterium]